MSLHLKNISIDQYLYDLPQEKIAFEPLEQRDTSKLLVYNKGDISSSKFSEIGHFLPQNSTLVFNQTKVVQARLHFKNINGASIEIFCLNPVDESTEITLAMAQKGWATWVCLVGNAKKWKQEFLHVESELKNIRLTAKILEKKANEFIVRLSWNKDLAFSEILETFGKMPLPPYIKRKAVEADKMRYQTVFATNEGSVAAPTAGLHFTPELIDRLHSAGITSHKLTLHVGAGTFMPVKSENLGGHQMHSEWIEFDLKTIERLASAKGSMVPVGTTAMRALESLYWIGVKALENPDLPVAHLLLQWEAYELPGHYSRDKALRAVVSKLKANGHTSFTATTELIIGPGYKPKMSRALITNFHQPGSTLLLLVSALIGENWKKVYAFALENNFRFLSYGDACLFLF